MEEGARARPRRIALRRGQEPAGYRWYPAVPFLTYWAVGGIAFIAGPFRTPALEWSTWFYLVAAASSFVISYGIVVHGEQTHRGERDRERCSKTLVRALLWTTGLTLIGSAIMVSDRLASGAGSFEKSLSETAEVREYYSYNTTWRTTIAVLPASFKIVALALYLFVSARHRPIPFQATLMMMAVVGLDLFNMVLMTNRGALFLLVMYVPFYVLFVKRRSVGDLLWSRRSLTYMPVAVVVVVAAGAYFFFIARNRQVESTVAHIGANARADCKIPEVIQDVDDATLGALFQLYTYGTHQFVYIDAFAKRAPLLAFEPGALMGIRVTAQIQRFWPAYVPTAKATANEWIANEGLSLSGWPGCFGWALAAFGTVGAVGFFAALGAACAMCVRRFVETERFAWFLLVVLCYVSLTISFDWFLVNFDQYTAMGIACTILIVKPKSKCRAKHSLSASCCGESD